MSDRTANPGVAMMDVWLVRLHGDKRIVKATVWNKFARTVELRLEPGIGSDFHLWDDVEFIEKVSK